MRAPPCGQLYVPPFGPNLESLEPRRPFRRAPQARDPRPAGASTTRSETVAMAIRSDPGLLPVGLAWSKSLEPPPIASTPPAAFGTPAMIVGSLVIVGLVGAQIAPFLLANPTAVGFVLCALLAAIAPNATEVRFSASYSPPYFSVMGLCAAVEATALVALLAASLLGQDPVRLQYPLVAAAGGFLIGQLLRLHRLGGSALLALVRLLHDAWAGRILLLAALLAAHVSFAAPTPGTGVSTHGRENVRGEAKAQHVAPTGVSKPAAPMASSLLVPPAPLFRFSSR